MAANLPAPLIPDFNEGISAYRQGYAIGQDQRKNALMQNAGQFAAKGDMEGARNALLGGGALDEGFKVQSFLDNQDERKFLKAKRLNESFGKLALSVKSLPPEQASAAWARIVDQGKRMGVDVSGFEDVSSIDRAISQSMEVGEYLKYLEDNQRRSIGRSMLPSQGGGGPASLPQIGGMDAWKASAANIESGNAKDPYRALGPVVQSGDRAYGKYQVMGANIAPWTREILGVEMTPQQFLDSPEAQERVFEVKFGQYVQQTGSPEAAASMWFTGRPSAPNAQARGADGQPIGITGQQYVDQFRRGITDGRPTMANARNALVAQPNQAGGINYDAGIRAALEAGDVGTALQLQQLRRPQKGNFEFTKYGVGNKDTGELRPYANASGDPEVTLEKGKFEQALRKEYTDLSKDFKTLQDATNRIKVGASLDNAVGDLSLIYGYMKLLDPGSVVRETEFATAENAQGVPDRIRNVWNRVINGERLTPQMRQQFVSGADQLAAQQTQRMQEVRTQFERIARESGAEPQRVMINEGLTSSGAKSNGLPAVGKVEDGYRFKGGNPADPNSWEKVQQ